MSDTEIPAGTPLGAAMTMLADAGPDHPAIVHRLKDMILVGGANVYPAEVEAALDAHPHVRSSCVIGLPDEDLGERVHAVVQAEDGLTEEELHGWVAERLAPYKTPRSYELTGEPLRDDAGKVRRSALRAERAARR